MSYQDLTGRGCWLFIIHARPVSFRYTSHVTTMFTYQTPTRHALLAVQKRPAYYVRVTTLDRQGLKIKVINQGQESPISRRKCVGAL